MSSAARRAIRAAWPSWLSAIQAPEQPLHTAAAWPSSAHKHGQPQLLSITAWPAARRWQPLVTSHVHGHPPAMPARHAQPSNQDLRPLPMPHLHDEPTAWRGLTETWGHAQGQPLPMIHARSQPLLQVSLPCVRSLAGHARGQALPIAAAWRPLMLPPALGLRGIRIQAHRRSAARVTQREDGAKKAVDKIAYDDEGQAKNRIKFVSMEKRVVPRPPFYRPPIYFPTISLQLHRPSPEQIREIRDLGWTRELAFRTTPDVTKLEIKGILEAVYGMSVERVHTMNYLGRKYVTFNKLKKLLWREADWKKAYVIFRPPPGVQLPAAQASSGSMMDQLLTARGLPPSSGP